MAARLSSVAVGALLLAAGVAAAPSKLSLPKGGGSGFAIAVMAHMRAPDDALHSAVRVLAAAMEGHEDEHEYDQELMPLNAPAPR